MSPMEIEKVKKMAKDFKSDVEKYGLTVTTTLDLPEQDPTALLRCQENFWKFGLDFMNY